MHHRYVGKILGAIFMANALVIAVLPPGSPAGPPPAVAESAPGGCADLTVPEENHSSIRLRVDQPADGAEVAVDSQGKIAIGGVLHKHATMVDVADGEVTSNDFVIGPPPEDVAEWASSWTTSLRPPNLGQNELCARAERDPERTARIKRAFTVVDRIPPSDVPGLTVGGITSSSAKVTWGEATDNYGLAGYEVTVDGSAAHRTTVGNRSYTITGLAPSSRHTVSVVALDLAGNKSTTPATASFTTAAPPEPPEGDLAFDAQQGGATATWHPELPATASYRVALDGEPLEEFPLEHYCLDTDGKPASPCTTQSVITYPIRYLEESTPHTFKVEALRADGTVAATLSGGFTTTTGTPVVPEETAQLTASESSRCAGMGGDVYLAASARSGVPVPAGGTQVFEGCYTVPDSSCKDRIRPNESKAHECSDDVTRFLASIAPPGSGPVISSLDDVAGSARSAFLASTFQPVIWCLQAPTACTVIVETAVETVKTAATAELAAAGLSWVFILRGGLIVGLVFWALWEIFFPSPIAIGGLLEYPRIRFDTDFRLFDRWWEEEGDWFSSLKIYAQTIKVTEELVSRYRIPFAWDDTKDWLIKSLIDKACAAQQGRPTNRFAACDENLAVYVPGGVNYKFRPMKETGTHIVKAMGDGGFPQPPTRAVWFYPGRSKGGQAATAKGYRPGWFDTLRFRPNACTGRPPERSVCDEFPFWTTDQAVDLTGMVADLQPVPFSEASPQGNDINQFYSQCDVDDGDRFIVLPLKPWVEANGPSFGFRVTPGGTSMCLVPNPAGP